MAATRRRWLAALQLSTAAYLFVVLYHAIQMGELRCLLADNRLGCDVPLHPGDVLFWREDVWHRTQDVEVDRVALRIDVLRFPFATDVAGYGN